MRLHRVVALVRRRVPRVDPHGRRRERTLEITKRRVRFETGIDFVRLVGFRKVALQIELTGLSLVAKLDKPCSRARRLEGLRNDERNRLVVIANQIVGENGSGALKRCGNIVQLRRAEGRLSRRVSVRHHMEHTGHALGGGCIDVGDAPLGDGRTDDKAIGWPAAFGVFISIDRPAGDLQRALNAVDRPSDELISGGIDRCCGGRRCVRRHDSPQACSAAWASVYRRVRFANAILKSLWPWPLASRSAISAAVV
jgi:hypothetical protein